MHAVILTGRTLPGHVPDAVWTVTARLFKLEPDPFKTRVLARCPLTIRETNDEAEAQRIVAALTANGAQIALIEADGGKWQVLRDGRTCGPVPLAYLKHEYQGNLLPGEARVKETADSNWTTLSAALGEPLFTLDVPPVLEDEVEEEPPPLPHRRSIAPEPTLTASAALAATGRPSVSSARTVDSPDNWWMHWLPLSLGMLLVMFVGTVATNSAAWTWCIVAASATWVYYDATKHRIGKIPGRSGNNFSAGTWAVLVALLWIVAFPFYVAKRRVLIAAASEHPVIAQLRVPILVGGCLAALLMLFQAGIPFAGSARPFSGTGPDKSRPTMQREAIPASTSAVPQKGTQEYDDAIARIRANKCQAFQAKWNRTQLDLDSGNVFAARDLAAISAAADMAGCTIAR